MTLQDLFDKLLIEREAVMGMGAEEAESLRVQLSKKWSKYKSDMDKCGFLSTELQQCSLGISTVVKEEAYKFTLAPKRRVRTYEPYEIINNPPSRNNDAPV